MLKLIQKIISFEIWSKPDIAVHKSRGSDLLDFLNVYDMLYVDANDNKADSTHLHIMHRERRSVKVKRSVKISKDLVGTIKSIKPKKWFSNCPLLNQEDEDNTLKMYIF